MQSASPLTERDPAVLGPYVLLGRVADGGMGVVYLGRHDGRADSLVAVKTLEPDVAADSIFRTRLRHEITAARALGELGAFGSSVARLVDADESPERPWLAWEYIPGPSLQTRVATAALPPVEVHAVARELADAIAQLHAAGYAHCDVKPANVVLGPDGLRLVDLGLAHDLREPAPTVAMGSPGWSPPEQSSPDRDGRALDVHGWGMCVACAALGGNPFGTGSESDVRRRMCAEAPRLDAVDDRLRPLVSAALAVDPESRPTMVEIVTLLAAIPAPVGMRAPEDSATVTMLSPLGATSTISTEAVASPTLIDVPAAAATQVAHVPAAARHRGIALLAAAAFVVVLLGAWWMSRPSMPAAAAAAPTPVASPSSSTPRPSPTAVMVPVAAHATPAAPAVAKAKAKGKTHGKGKPKHR